MPADGWRPAAVLWDLDGTLLDSEPLWIRAEHDLAAKYGAVWTEADGLELVGNDLPKSGAVIREKMGLPLSAAEIVEELLDYVVAGVERTVSWRPGALELLTEMGQLGVPCALVTMSYRRFVKAALAALPEDTFAAVVAGDDVAHGKPHPEPYLLAAELLRVSPGDCIAIEDSPTGASSAQAAGCRVVAVPLQVRFPFGAGVQQLRSLKGVTLRDLAALFARGPGD
jgi:HAD superfamily hydrolase (TIGR01509 family)